jgi:hypothetical protein
MKTKNKKVLVLRTCNSNMTSHGGFKWPKKGRVKAPDWDPNPECGHGLHGLLWGEGNGVLLNWDEDAKWLVVSVDTVEIVDLKDKVKFPRGIVVFCGDQEGATKYISKRAPKNSAVVGLSISAGNYGQATAGDRGKATAGDHGEATAGDKGLLILSWYDPAANRRRVTVAYVGEDGIKPNKTYKLNEKTHKPVEVTK